MTERKAALQRAIDAACSTDCPQCGLSLGRGREVTVLIIGVDSPYEVEVAKPFCTNCQVCQRALPCRALSYTLPCPAVPCPTLCVARLTVSYISPCPAVHCLTLCLALPCLVLHIALHG